MYHAFKTLFIFSVLVMSFLMTSIANAKPMRYASVAICHTGGTNIAYPYYVCCKKIDKTGQSWQKKWVASNCKNADPMAVPSRGCKSKSPVYNTGLPIMGQCQFSWMKMQYNPVYKAKI